MNPEPIKPNRPEPILLKTKPYQANKHSSEKDVCELLLSGQYILINDEYPTGLNLLSVLKKRVFGSKKKSDFKAYREKRSEYHHASNRLLAPIENNQVALDKSPEIGWLEKLYPDQSDFILPFPQVQGLNSSWQWYVNGIKYPVLEQKIHPYYGTYFPTRSDHLILFDDWLKTYSGKKKAALDLGTGCGILAFQLLNRGFEKVYATDINPNSMISVAENAKRLGVQDRLEVWQSDLFENVDQTVDLMVFNPPWLPAEEDITGLDSAIYYKPGLFERIFEKADDHITENGKIVLLFSNLGQTSGMETRHPIREELATNQRFRKITHIRKKADKPSRKTRRRDHREKEFVELWVLGTYGTDQIL